MSWVAAAVGIGSAVSGMFGASKAAGAQEAAARQAAQAQLQIFDKQTELQKPFREAGVTGLNRLMYLLGLSTDGGPSGTGQAQTYGDIRNQLLKDYTKQQPVTNKVYNASWTTEDPNSAMYSDVPGMADVIDESGLDAAIQKRMADQAAAKAAGVSADKDYGSLMRDFSMSDFEADPGYAFRLSEGMKALDRSAAARGGLQSGAALKAAARYGQDMGSQEYQNAFNRYQINRANKLNPLQSLSGMAQTSANTMTGAAGQLGQNLGEAYTGAGNARASGYMGAANAVAGGLGQYANYQQGQNWLNTLRGNGGYGSLAGMTPTVESYYGY